MEKRSKRRGADGVIHVHVVEDNHRIEPAKFQHGPLQSPPGTFRQHSRRLDASDQIDDPDFWTIEELVGNGSRGARRMRYNVNHPRREPGFLCDLGEHDPR